MTPDRQLPHSTPEAQGIPSSAIRAFVDAADGRVRDLHSFMLVRHGQIVAAAWWSPYAPEHPHMLFSLSKSFCATAVGLAAAEGLLALDDPVLQFFPGDAPAKVGEHLAAMRVRHLLSMSTGHAQDTTPALHAQADGDWARAFLAQPVEYAPGTHFVYNSGATYMLSAIVQLVSGATLLEYLRPRLLEPLGIERATWESSPRGVNIGWAGLSITTADIARFGQLYLQRGMWNGRRILPEGWVADASARHVSNGDDPQSDWAQGYGYQFWRCRHGAYRADGAFGQFCVVMPEQDAVLAVTAGVRDMQAALNLVWRHLLPAMQPAPLPEDAPAQAELRRRLAGLALPPAQGRRAPAVAAQVSGQRYVFEPNDYRVDSVVFDFDADGCVLTVCDDRGEHRVACGGAGWLYGTTTLDMRGPLKTAASGAWADENTYVIALCYYETPFCPTITAHFADDRLALGYSVNVSFGPTELPPIEGRRA